MHPILRGFQQRNFRLFFIGQTLTRIGTCKRCCWRAYLLRPDPGLARASDFAVALALRIESWRAAIRSVYERLGLVKRR